MGVVVLQIGQGGNQMGCALFQCLASMSASTPWEFFRSSSRTPALIARSILVDMEPKVIAAMVKQAKRCSAQHVPWVYDSHRQVTQDSGAGNNWAHGYHSYGPKCQESILDAVRLEGSPRQQGALTPNEIRDKIKNPKGGGKKGGGM